MSEDHEKELDREAPVRRWTLQEWASVAQIAATVGVLVSLVALAYQLRENTRTLRLNQMQATLANYNAVRLALMGDPNFAHVALTGFADRDALSEVDQFRFNSFMDYLFYSGHAHFTRTVEVSQNSGLWNASALFYQRLVQENPGAAAWWCSNNGGFNPAFIQSVELGWESSCSEVQAANKKPES